tara:strand:- start:235 stop:381 length:147 start_codon:yes stop_codon:yes gene_type:complete
MSAQNKLANLGRNLCASFTNPALQRSPIYAHGAQNTVYKAGINAKPAP